MCEFPERVERGEELFVDSGSKAFEWTLETYRRLPDSFYATPS